MVEMYTVSLTDRKIMMLLHWPPPLPQKKVYLPKLFPLILLGVILHPNLGKEETSYKRLHGHLRQSKPYAKEIETWLAMGISIWWNEPCAGISKIPLVARYSDSDV